MSLAWSRPQHPGRQQPPGWSIDLRRDTLFFDGAVRSISLGRSRQILLEQLVTTQSVMTRKGRKDLKVAGKLRSKTDLTDRPLNRPIVALATEDGWRSLQGHGVCT